MDMINAGSKGGELNVVQMAACLGQQKVEGHLPPVPGGPHSHHPPPPLRQQPREDLLSLAVARLEAQRVLLPRNAGREGLIDTAVKSVTGDTAIVVFE
jgi:DNA-directed RNA polymerase beta' subunit